MDTPPLKYLGHYPEHVLIAVREHIRAGRLGEVLASRYPALSTGAPALITTDAALREYVLELKQAHLRRSPPLSKICFDDKHTTMHRALGLHTYVSRVQGSKLKAKNELRVASLLKQAPHEFLRMVVVHELAHLKEREHNKAFYQLCCHMEPNYHQYEFDLRLYLTERELAG